MNGDIIGVAIRRASRMVTAPVATVAFTGPAGPASADAAGWAGAVVHMLH
jgi:hypothetical protein